MKKLLIAAIFTCMFVISAYADQGPGFQGPSGQGRGQGSGFQGPPNQGPGQNQGPEAGQGQSFEQKRSEILQHIDQRFTNLQSFKSCVQAAKSHDDLRSCRQKYGPQNQNNH